MIASEGRLQTKFPTVRQLSSLHQALEALSAQDVEEVCRRVRRVGQLFRRADPLNNPWRGRQPTIRIIPATRADLGNALEKLRSLDAEHLQQVQKNGSGGPLPVKRAGLDHHPLLQRARSHEALPGERAEAHAGAVRAHHRR